MSRPGANGSPGVKSGCRMIDCQSSLLVHGGRDEHDKLTNDLHKFDIAAGEFKLS